MNLRRHLAMILLFLTLAAAAGCSIKITKQWGDSGTGADAEAGPGDGQAEEGLAIDTYVDAIPTHTVVDDDFAHFRQGTFSEAGARIYATAKGQIRLLDSHDLNNDGLLDLAFANYHGGTSHIVNSFIYFGSASGSYSISSRALLPTIGAEKVATHDLNQDGYPDAIYANQKDSTQFSINSYIYWGSATGYTAANKALLPTHGASGISAGDLDQDGYLDLVFSNNSDGTSNAVNSYIYWGSSNGYSRSKRLGLPTVGARENAVADLNNDGYLDIVFCNMRSALTYTVNSYIYWGGAAGFAPSRRSELPTKGAIGCTVADLNKDSQPDILVSNFYDGLTHLLNSVIFWGAAGGFSDTRVQHLPTAGAAHGSVADLNNDGHLDIVFSNFYNGTSHQQNSYIYWGATAGFSSGNRATLPTIGAHASAVADLNMDGHLDIAFANRFDDTTHAVNSYIYWGSKAGFDSNRRSTLPSLGASGANLMNMGSVTDRTPVHSFISRALDTTRNSPTYTTLSWTATVPNKTSLKFQLRSAASAVALKSAKWYGASTTQDYYVVTSAVTSLPINTAHNGDRYIQYRAVLSNDFTSTPVLDRVVVTYY